MYTHICFQEITLCLGVEGIVGICERLIHNFQLWKAGFPDLIVWNACTKQVSLLFYVHNFKSLYILYILYLRKDLLYFSKRKLY